MLTLCTICRLPSRYISFSTKSKRDENTENASCAIQILTSPNYIITRQQNAVSSRCKSYISKVIHSKKTCHKTNEKSKQIALQEAREERTQCGMTSTKKKTDQ